MLESYLQISLLPIVTLFTELWLLTSITFLVDNYLYNTGLWSKYKIAEVKPNEMVKYRSTIKDVLVTQGVMFPIIISYTWYFKDSFITDRSLPSRYKIIFDMTNIMLMTDTWFYFMHRLCHEVPFLYKNVHKKHHEWVNPVTATVIYASHIENVFINIGPLYFIAHAINMNWYTWMLWIHTATLNTSIIHSGYKWVPNKNHDYHHKKRDVAFGSGFGLWDYILGTRVKDKYPHLQ